MGVLSNAIRMGASQPAAADGDLQLGKSVRFDHASSTKIIKGISTEGNRRVWTWAGWFKRVTTGGYDYLFAYGPDGAAAANWILSGFQADDTLWFGQQVGGGYTYQYQTNAVIKDTAGWIHLTVKCDTTEVEDYERFKIYLNGEQVTSFSTATHPSQNVETWMTSTSTATHIYTGLQMDGHYLDGYMADVFLCDGVALNPGAFIERDASGYVKPKAFAPPNPNDGTTWSSGGTTVGNWNEPNYGVGELFDGNISGTPGGACSDTNAWNGARYTLPSTVAVKTEVKVYTNATDDRWGYDIGNGFERAANLPAPQGSSAPYVWTLPKTTEFKGIACSDAQQIFGIMVDGVVLKDGATDPSTRNNVNNNITWSSSCSGGTDTGNEHSKAFDGTGATYAYPSPGSTVTFTPSSAIPFKRLRAWITRDANGGVFTLNGSTNYSPPNSGVSWVDIAYNGTLTSLAWARQSSGSIGIGVKAIEIDGHMLLDGSDDNSFNLKFDNPATNAAIGTDSFGNGAHTITNLTTSDCFTDVPQNYGTDTGTGGEVRGNFCTLNSLANGGLVLSEGGLKVAEGSGPSMRVLGTIGNTSGKWYFEITNNSTAYDASGVDTNSCVGISDFTESLSTAPGFDANSYIYQYASDGNGTKKINNSTDTSWPSGDTAGTGAGVVLMVAYDLDNNKIWFGRNGSWLDSGNPATGANPVYTLNTGVTYTPCVRPRGTGGTNASVNFGQRAFTHTAPSGFKALCSHNLGDPFSEEGHENNTSKVFSIRTYNGTGEATRNLTYPFSPDFIWIKARSNSGWQHVLYDRIRGAGSGSTTTSLSTNDTRTAASGNDTNHGHLSAFNSDGVTLTKGSQGGGDYVNHDGWTYAGWCWDAGSSVASTSNSGSATNYTRWTNSEAGFSIIKATISTGSGYHQKTLDHGLSVAPDFIIDKGIDANEAWRVYHSAIGTGKVFFLNTTDDQDTSSWKVTATSGSQFTFDSYGSSQNNIFYVWAAKEGYSHFDKYAGGTAGKFIACGFKPKLVLIKCYDVAGESWFFYDSERGSTAYLCPDTTLAELTNANTIHFNSNGFILAGTGNDSNGSSKNYIFGAWAENPFKTANGGGTF